MHGAQEPDIHRRSAHARAPERPTHSASSACGQNDAQAETSRARRRPCYRPQSGPRSTSKRPQIDRSHGLRGDLMGCGVPTMPQAATAPWAATIPWLWRTFGGRRSHSLGGCPMAWATTIPWAAAAPCAAPVGFGDHTQARSQIRPKSSDADLGQKWASFGPQSKNWHGRRSRTRADQCSALRQWGRHACQHARPPTCWRVGSDIVVAAQFPQLLVGERGLHEASPPDDMDCPEGERAATIPLCMRALARVNDFPSAHAMPRGVHRHPHHPRAPPNIAAHPSARNERPSADRMRHDPRRLRVRMGAANIRVDQQSSRTARARPPDDRKQPATRTEKRAPTPAPCASLGEGALFSPRDRARSSSVAGGRMYE